MKGSVPRPPWPAPVAEATSAPVKKKTGSSATDLDAATEPPINPTNRITLAVLEEFAAARAKGYDPYNSPVVHRPLDAWQRKRKRD